MKYPVLVLHIITAWSFIFPSLFLFWLSPKCHDEGCGSNEVTVACVRPCPCAFLQASRFYCVFFPQHVLAFTVYIFDYSHTHLFHSCVVSKKDKMTQLVVEVKKFLLSQNNDTIYWAVNHFITLLALTLYFDMTYLCDFILFQINFSKSNTTIF